MGFARSLTRELGSRGITANVVAPGFIETDMTAALPEATQAEYKTSIPAGRFATPDEVAGVVAWLASDDAGLHLRRGHPGRRRPRHGPLSRLSGSSRGRTIFGSRPGSRAENCGQCRECSSTISRSSTAASSAAQSGADAMMPRISSAGRCRSASSREHGAAAHLAGRGGRSEPAPGPTWCSAARRRVRSSRSAISGSS